MLKAITPKIDARKLEKLIVRKASERMNEFQSLLVKDFQSTVKDWKKKPDFDEKKVVDSNRVVVEVSTDNEIYYYVSHGTRIRYATMSQGFQAKTSPKRIPSRRGRGGMLYVSKKRPRPGIEGRKFDKQIKNKREKTFARIMKGKLREISSEVN